VKIVGIMIPVPRMALAPQQRRRLAVTLSLDGEPAEQVAELVQVSQRSIWRWLGAYRRHGESGLVTRPGQGRPPKLSARQRQQVIDWVTTGSACDFGFVTDRWTAPRLAWLIEDRWGVRMNHRYLNDWLWRHGRLTPQVPQRRAVERDEGVIGQWVARQWPEIKKRPSSVGPA